MQLTKLEVKRRNLDAETLQVCWQSRSFDVANFSVVTFVSMD